jgi:hypothetical protein
MHVRRVGLKLSIFGQPQSVRESVIMMRRLIQILSKFRRHNPDVLRCTISGVQSENSSVMLPKFHPDLNQESLMADPSMIAEAEKHIDDEIDALFSLTL